MSQEPAVAPPESVVKSLFVRAEAESLAPVRALFSITRFPPPRNTGMADKIYIQREIRGICKVQKAAP
ncbi:hypothetical protein J2W34_000875 [Variovorax boronicumulans]|uniref:hypothetical protein n=1 Tax=Variovorax boronicumulans TaxID=436515 RepID=UPI00278743E3|nr:hypothetical protein [Variovorax boronicumulans]MDQ0069101.1 hypothetical protein [Variovorax boronicumulans]